MGDLYGFTCCPTATAIVLTLPTPATYSEDGSESYVTTDDELDGLAGSAFGPIRVFQQGQTQQLTSLVADVVLAGESITGSDLFSQRLSLPIAMALYPPRYT
jgi:hypothetical protein